MKKILIKSGLLVVVSFAMTVFCTSCMSCCEIGQMYESGDGRKQSSRKAFEWYQFGAENGEADSQYRLALCYDNGVGTKINTEKAAEWYKKSAAQGYEKAVKALMQKEEKRIVEEKQIADEIKRANDPKVKLEKLNARWKKVKEGSYAIITNLYSYDAFHNNRAFRNNRGLRKVELSRISNWILPRNKNLNHEEFLKGEALLDSFADKYMVNARKEYQEARQKFQEFQSKFNEVYPKSSEMHQHHQDWNPYCEFLRKLVGYRLGYLRKRDELMHFYFMHKMKLMTSEELAKIDAQPIYWSPVAINFFAVQGIGAQYDYIYELGLRPYTKPNKDELNFAEQKLVEIYSGCLTKALF